ncbi:hypothetical protein L5014_38390, partial [Paraburkholderia sp. RG36]|nr:hypothetical protein [Paraburkholderia tagetis]
MSEYQYYEFACVDQLLTATQQAELRSFSTRATITASSFVNEYHWGNLEPPRVSRRCYGSCESKFVGVKRESQTRFLPKEHTKWICLIRPSTVTI